MKAFLHELAHLKHGDDWIMLWAEVARMSWFYPPVRPARLPAREREYRCDDVASSRSEGPEGTHALLDTGPGAC